MQSIKPRSVASFRDTLGANTHIGWGGSASSWSDQAAVKTALAYLGIGHIREAIPSRDLLPRYLDLADAGVKFCIVAHDQPPDPDRDIAGMRLLQQAKSGAIVAYEGLNEWNTHDYWVQGMLSRDNPAFGKHSNDIYYGKLRADPLFKDVRYFGGTLSSVGDAFVSRMGVAGKQDAVTWHTYFGPAEQPGVNVGTGIGYARRTGPGLPMVFTEIGHSTAPAASEDWGTGGNASTSPKLMLNVIFDGAWVEADRVYIYMLIDNNTDPNDQSLENRFGLCFSGARPKAAATAVHNLTTILGTGAPTPVPLDMELTNLPTGARSLVLQGDRGHFVAVWAEADVWRGGRYGAEYISPSSAVRLTLGQGAKIEGYDPAKALEPTMTVQGTSAVMPVSDRVVLFRVTGLGTVGPVVGGPAVMGPAELVAERRLLGLSVSDPGVGGLGLHWIAVDATGGLVLARRADGSVQVASTPGFYLEGTLLELNRVLSTLAWTPTSGPASVQVKYGTGTAPPVVRVFAVK